MRKRLVIGVIALLLVAVVVLLLTDRHPDTIEYHAKAYVKEQKWSERDLWIAINAPQQVRRLARERKGVRFDRHQNALIRLGFLQQNTVAVSNASAFNVMMKAFANMGTNCLPEPFFDWRVLWPATNVIQLVAKPRDVEIWTDLIRQADVPETK